MCIRDRPAFSFLTLKASYSLTADAGPSPPRHVPIVRATVLPAVGMPVSYTHLDVYKRQIVDAVGGTSRLAHETALRRMEQAGVQLTSVTQYICELQREMCIRDSFYFILS